MFKVCIMQTHYSRLICLLTRTYLTSVFCPFSSQKLSISVCVSLSSVAPFRVGPRLYFPVKGFVLWLYFDSILEDLLIVTSHSWITLELGSCWPVRLWFNSLKTRGAIFVALPRWGDSFWVFGIRDKIFNWGDDWESACLAHMKSWVWFSASYDLIVVAWFCDPSRMGGLGVQGLPVHSKSMG